MRQRLLPFAGVLGLTVFLASSPSAFAQSTITTDTWAIAGGTISISPTQAPILNGVVLLKSGKIDAVGPRSSVTLSPGIKVLDCSGLTIMAGFWNTGISVTCPGFLTGWWSNLPKTGMRRSL